jgi:serine/threonine-protein kinase
MVGRVFLGRYEPIKLLGEGGMGRVYLAKQSDLGRQVVVKVMHDHIAADPKFRERFQRETLLMARFQHPCVVALYDASLNDPEGPCIVMEYIKGISLDVLLKRNGRLSAARITRLLSQLCEALQAAHKEGIVHRDLKPSNLMVVDPDTPYEKIKVMDFGLAKLVADDAGMGMYHKAQETGADFAVGTPGYISPEQVRGEDIGYRSDLYSVGVILYELLAGRLPFHREETMDVLLAHATEAPPSFAEIGVSEAIPLAVERVVMSCLQKDPTLRPASARDLAQAFEQAIFEDEMNATADQQSPETEADVVATLPPPAKMLDPNTLIYQMEAWMPDSLASYKLRGFVQDMSGEVLVSQPGITKVRLEDLTGSTWGLFKKRGVIDMELTMERNNTAQPNWLLITVVMSSPDAKAFLSATWRERCNQIFVELRAYLVGSSVSPIS